GARKAEALELVGIAQHRAPVITGLGNRRGVNEPMPARAVVAHELRAARVVGRRVTDVAPGCGIILPLRPADEEAAVQQDEAGAGRQEDVTGEVDRAEHTGALPAADRDAAKVVMLAPKRHTARVTEVGIDVMLIEGLSAGDATDLRTNLAVLIELANLGGGAAGFDFDHDLEAHRHLRGHLGAAVEDEA